MTMINLKDHYPFCREDCCMEVSEDLAELFAACDRREAAYRSRVRYHKAYYSLDRGDGIENAALHVGESPEEICVQNEAKRELYEAMRRLSGKQHEHDGNCSCRGCRLRYNLRKHSRRNQKS